jgi:hypothetical protein
MAILDRPPDSRGFKDRSHGLIHRIRSQRKRHVLQFVSASWVFRGHSYFYDNRPVDAFEFRQGGGKTNWAVK